MSRVQNLIIWLAHSIEKFSIYCGKLISWLTFLMVLVVFLIVIMRYGFSLGSIALQEAIIYLHGMVFLLAAGFTLQQDEHVRVDIFYNSMSHQRRAWVDLIGTLLFLFPFCIFLFSMSLEYVLSSWRINEGSGESGGLPGLYLLKSMILIMPVLMMLQGLAWILRCLLFLFFEDESPYISAKQL